MPIATWKIMLRRTGQVGYHYAGTQQTGRPPVVGDKGKVTIDGQRIRWAVAEVFKDHKTRSGAEVFTVRVEEIKSGQ
jgi:hypothetical protein